ncbi:restriction endonuclease PLD domain-containing protein [Lysinibacillus tabacifolii]|uniref:NgoFVII family restriction endonuclease n=1 Tax=Lysinibacillus tabacifolii TaxID=1173107 RepID=A0ABY2SU49_9BACI|nr:restriction endonuclease PLD domain-containing protein [Lysinibacillus tabacifolii]TKI46255.1 NgoFVII family restriction endonuclease [Lysinibacillus tabacifolii]
MIFENQNVQQQEDYIRTLQAVGSLSNLFSDNEVPYLYYRAAENIFCRTLNANNLSRGDITFDALKDGVGIALKTFQHRNGNCVEKIAEFNDAVEEFQGRSSWEIMNIVSELRNARIHLAIRLTDAEEMIYHLVTRKEGEFEIHEEELEYIDINNLILNTRATTNKTIWFTDGRHEYKFSKSKSTLYKRFITNNPIASFEVDILSDPYSFLLNQGVNPSVFVENVLEIEEQYETVILPLYSARSGLVEERSGLNQWNAGGRLRHEDEIYIPIPSWIHRQFEGFFPYDRETERKDPFILILPNGRELSAKVCQSGGKGFMSNPNRELGYWLLRHVLQIPPGELVTNEHLESVGIDSVVVTKLDDFVFRIDFATTGTYEEFEENNR